MNNIDKIKEIIKSKNIDAALIYGSKGNDAMLKWIFGIESIEENYALITAEEVKIFEVGYLYEDLKSKTDLMIEVLKNKEELLGAISFLTNSKKVGYAGPAPYSDLIKFKCKLVDISQDIAELMKIKSESEIECVKKAAKIYLSALSTIKITPGVSEKEIADEIENEIKKTAELAFSISVSSGSKLKKTTCSTPSDYKIKNGDVVCIDGGASVSGYKCDVTRCFFTSKKYKEEYEKLCSAHYKIISKIKSGMTASEIYQLYSAELGDKFVKLDLGHGVGCNLHELPDLDDLGTIIEDGMVFTLEPEIDLGEIKLRVEDTVAMINGKLEVLSNGK